MHCAPSSLPPVPVPSLQFLFSVSCRKFPVLCWPQFPVPVPLPVPCLFHTALHATGQCFCNDAAFLKVRAHPVLAPLCAEGCREDLSSGGVSLSHPYLQGFRRLLPLCTKLAMSDINLGILHCHSPPPACWKRGAKALIPIGSLCRECRKQIGEPKAGMVEWKPPCGGTLEEGFLLNDPQVAGRQMLQLRTVCESGAQNLKHVCLGQIKHVCLGHCWGH